MRVLMQVPRRFPPFVRILFGLLVLCGGMVTSIAGISVQAQSVPSSYKSRIMNTGMTGMADVLTGVPGSGWSPLQIQAVVQASIQVNVNEFDSPLASLDPGSSTRMALVITDSRMPYRMIHPDGNTVSPCQTGGALAGMPTPLGGIGGSTGESMFGYSLESTNVVDSGLLAKKNSNKVDLSAQSPAEDRTCLQSVIFRKRQALVLLLTAL